MKLTTRQMATFAARGFLRFDSVVPDEINRAAVDEMARIVATWGSADRPFAPESGARLSEIYPDPSALGSVLRLATVQDVIASLVGPDPTFDHDFVHLRMGGDLSEQPLHADAVIDTNLAFDVQLFYFPHEVGPGEGGTGFVPGTHLRRVNENDVARYQHLLGHEQFSGPAGTILVFHHGLWHHGLANRSDAPRWMYKIRLNPTVAQVRLWDTSDLDAMHNSPADHIFARFAPDGVASILRTPEPWMSNAEYRLEEMQRAQLWRYLTGDGQYDVDYYLTRIENRTALGNRS